MHQSRISLASVEVAYPLHDDDVRSFKRQLAIRFEGRKVQPQPFISALRGVSLTVNRGERLGIIGPNGAGKTTLLKVMAGIYPPTRGRAEIIGDVSPLLNLGVGFDQDLTGMENIEHRLRLMGLSREQIRELSPQIAEFSELGDKLHLPMRTYSSGMFVRLAFSVITSVKPDILILDEFLGAGDLAFMTKAEERMERLLSEGSIVVVASHSLEGVVAHCTRTVLMEAGRVVADGQPAEVVAEYHARQGAGL